MKKTTILLASAFVLMLAACGGKCKCNCNCGCDKCTCTQDSTSKDSAAVAVDADGPQTVMAQFKADKDGYITLFDGKTLNGWRGYGMDKAPEAWDVKDGAIHINATGTGEAHADIGGDLMFAHKFKNFELTFEYKVSKGANSGVFYMAREVKDNKGEYLPIWQSASEYQVLDNANHPDAQLGVDGNRQSASLYDMISAKPQNAKPYGEWNTAKIMVYKGTVVHGQNGKNVVEYHLWTPRWTDMLQDSKFKEGGEFPYAFELMNNMGGKNHEGYIALQDHGDEVWYRNIKVKELK